MITVSGAAGKSYRTVTVSASASALKTAGVPVGVDASKSVITRVELSGGGVFSTGQGNTNDLHIFTPMDIGLGIRLSGSKLYAAHDYIPIISVQRQSAIFGTGQFRNMAVTVEIREEIA